MTSRASTTEQDKKVEDKRGMQDRTSQEKTRPRQHLDEDRLDRTEHRGQKTDLTLSNGLRTWTLDSCAGLDLGLCT